MHRFAHAVVALALLAGCSGGDGSVDVRRSDDAGASIGSSSTSVPSPTASSVVGPAPLPAESTMVAIDASVDGEMIRFEGSLTAAADPFGEFISCSGGRSTFTNYALVASRTSGSVRALTVATDDLVDDVGIHDATIRVEFSGGDVLDGVGTMTLEPGFRTGTFTAFSDSGALVEGAFECGVGLDPAPLELGADDGRPDTVDAVALLRTPQGERLVGFATPVQGVTAMQCQAVDSAAPLTDVIVQVVGDASIGAVTTFELVGGSSPTLVMRAGATDYRFEDVSVSVTGATGTFSATSDDVTVDGAYRCT